MQGKLFAVEGASASGKDTLLSALKGVGHVVVRGVGSQTPEDNLMLLPSSREILGDTVLNFRETLKRPDTERDEVFRKFIKIAALQQEEAVRLKNEGNIVFLNRSAISLVSIIQLPQLVMGESDEKKWLKWTQEMLQDAVTIENELSGNLDGIILMRKASVGGKEREGTAGVAELESSLISNEALKINKEKDIQMVEIDADLMSVEEELAKVKATFKL